MRHGIVFIILSCFMVEISLADRKPIIQCDFDDGLCPGWKNEKGYRQKWKVMNGPAKKAGPKYDHTRGNKEGGYLFYDDEGAKFAAKGLIRTPIMDLSKQENHCLRFYWFSRGRAPGEFRIKHSNTKRGQQVSLYFRAGTQSQNSTHWNFVDVTVPKFDTPDPFDQVYFQIQAIRGLTTDNVVAVDDFSVTPGPCPEFEFGKTFTTAIFKQIAPTDATGVILTGGGDGSDLTNEEVIKRNKEILKENEERNRRIQEMNDLINRGQYSTTQDPNQPTQPTQPIQPTQPGEEQQQHNTEGMTAEEQRRKQQEEDERKRKEEQEKRDKEERERKEVQEKQRQEQEERQRKQNEEEKRKNKKIQEKKRLETERKEREEKERKEIEAKKIREMEELKVKKRQEREKRLREEAEKKTREEAERKRKLEEERKRKLEEDHRKMQGQRQKQKKQKGDIKKERRGKKQHGSDKANDPNYLACGAGFAHKDKQLCCEGKIRPKAKPTSQCCGRKTYNTLKKRCCGRKVFALGPAKQCCGEKIYKPTEKGCCGTKLFDITGNMQCCTNALYDATTSGCCSETIFSSATNDCVGGVVVQKA